MMCLGWDNSPVCQPPDVVQVIAPSPSATATASGTGVPLSGSGGVAATCPDITWFWISAFVIGVGALTKGVVR